MIPAAFDYQDPADTERGWDDEPTSVDECVHGEHPIECASCTSSGFIAAVSGEGDDMQDIDKMMGERVADFETTLASLIERANDLQLKQIRYALEREEKRRIAAARDTIRAFGGAEPKQRATRKDAGMKREEYKATKGAA